MRARTWRRSSWTSRAIAGRSRDTRRPPPHLGADVPAPGAVPAFLAAAAGAGLLAGVANVHLGLHRELPGSTDRQPGRPGWRDAAGRRAAVGGCAAQPD